MALKIITDAQALARFDRLITRAKAEATRKRKEATCTSSASKPPPSTVSAAA